MNKTTTILILICIATTAGALWWISQLGGGDDDGPPLAEWTTETGNRAPESTSSKSPAPKLPAPAQRNPRANQRGERVALEDPAERDSDAPPTLAEIGTLADSVDTTKHLLALDLLRDMDTAAAWPALKKLLGSESVQVRAEAVELAAEFDDENTGAFLAEAVTDASPYVGLTVLEAAEELGRDERETIRRAAIKSAPAEVGTSVLADVEVESNYRSVDFLIEGLSSDVEDTREDSREVLEFLFDEQFENAATANQWWQQNRANYDRDLVEKE